MSLRFIAAATIFAFAAAACTTVETHTTGSIVLPDPSATLPAHSTASHTSVIVKAMGVVPYDGFTLPLLSPDGRFVATQTGVPPMWTTLLGSRAGGPPRASGIEVWTLEERGAKRAFTLQKGYVLGRSADASGFVIEAPQTDGSRRIGRVRWPLPSAATEPDPEAPSEGTPEWIVSDGRVNIYPTLGPDGALAWCARDVDATDFALVVRRGDVSFEIPPEQAQSWMLPAFANDGSLFALRVREGVTELAHAACDDQDAFEQSLTVERLSLRSDAKRAWQTLAPVDAASAIVPGIAPQLLLLDPDLGRMAIWEPGQRGVRPLPTGSFAACVGEDGSILWSDDDGVVATPPQPLAGSTSAAGVASSANSASTPDVRADIRAEGPRVYDRPAVPRRLAGDLKAWLLLVPDNRSMGVVRLTLVTPPRTSGPARK